MESIEKHIASFLQPHPSAAISFSMPKSIALKRHCFCPILCCVFIAAASALCQSTPLPSDPKDLMRLAAQSNSIGGADMQPWHLKFHFQAYDEKGHPTGQGTFEEYWAGTHKSKIIYTSPEFTETRYETETGVLFSGERDPAPEIFGQIFKQFINPMALDEHFEQATVMHEKRDVNKSKLLCITQKTRITQPLTYEYIGPWYCLDPGSSALRAQLSNSGYLEFTRDNPVRLQDHLVPSVVSSVRGKTIRYTATLDTAETLATVNDADFTAPSTALPPPRVVSLSPEVALSFIVSQPKPLYPPIAVAARVSGTVIIDITITTHGRVVGARVTSGPAMLQQAAMETVKNWTFKHFTDKGEPVQVETQVAVQFKLPL
jgi:TonB family protein